MITKEQLIERRTGLGGSDIAGILGISPWTRPIDVYLDKKGLAGDEPKRETEAMWWGNEEEELVARRFMELTGRKLVNYNRTIHDGCLLANIDRLLVPEGEKIAAHQGEIRTTEFAEIKTSGSEWPEAAVIGKLGAVEVLDGAAGCPEWYQCQVFHYFGRLKTCRMCYIPVKMQIPTKGKGGGFFARTEFRVYRLDRDDEIIREQDAFARAWWAAYIEGDKVPSAETEEDAKRLWRVARPNSVTVALTDTLKAWRRYADAKAATAKAEAEEGAAKAAVEIAMGDTEALVGPDGETVIATWKNNKDKVSTVTDWERLAREKGVTEDEIKAATTTTTSPGARVLRLKGGKAEDYVDAEIAKAEFDAPTGPAEQIAEQVADAKAVAA